MMAVDAFSVFEHAGLNDEEVSLKELFGKIGLHGLATYLELFYYSFIYTYRI